MQRADVYIETDSNGTRSTSRRYGYVLECEICGRTWTKEGFGQAEGTYNQATLLVMAEALKLILSRLVDTFSSRILYPMLLLSGNHSIAVV